MSDQVDPLDQLLRRAMATLDDHIPAGTFDTLAERTLLRLDDPSLRDEPWVGESPGEDPGRTNEAVAVPPVAEVIPLSGQRARASRRSRSTAAWTAVGLGLAAAAGAMVFVATRDQAEVAPAVSVRSRDRADALAPPASPAGTLTANRAPVVALPARSASEDPLAGSAAAAATPEGAPAIARVEKIAADVEPGVTKPEPATGRVVPQPPMTKGGAKGAASFEPKKTKAGKGKGTFYEVSPEDPAPLGGKVAPIKSAGPAGPDGGGSPGEHAKPAGVPPQKQGKFTLDPKALSNDEVVRGMSALAAQVKACAAGTLDRASVRLTVAPSGRVQQVTVAGALAGTSVGACIERTVKTATFSSWDGEPAVVDYEYLLSR